MYPDDPPFSNSLSQYLISKETNILTFKSFQIDFQGNTQYNEWQLSNVEFDKHEKTDIGNILVEWSQEYKIEQYKPRRRNEIKPLELGSVAPQFEGYTYPDSSLIRLSDYAGKLVLIDFWYMACYPCVLAIPHLSELYDKYKDEGLVVLGLNSSDGKEKNRKRIPKFLEHNNLTYPIIFMDRKVPKEYKVDGYPSFFIINKEGKVIFGETGFGELMVPKIDSVVMANL